MYTALNAIVLALEKIRKPNLYFSVRERHVCVFCRYWKESTPKNISAMERRNMIVKKANMKGEGLAFLLLEREVGFSEEVVVVCAWRLDLRLNIVT